MFVSYDTFNTRKKQKDKFINPECIMSQNGQTYFKNLATFAARFLKLSDHFETLCIKGLPETGYYQYYYQYRKPNFQGMIKLGF